MPKSKAKTRVGPIADTVEDIRVKRARRETTASLTTTSASTSGHQKNEGSRTSVQPVKQKRLPQDAAYIKGLQRALIDFYRDHHNSIPLSPIADDYEAPIVDFYVQPPVVSVDIQHRFLDQSPNKTPVTSYQQLLFSSQGTAHRNIYVTAPPGNGKTAFCKRLCATWCQAHDPQKALSDRFSPEDKSALKHFEFVFYIPLREVDKTICYVDDMIRDSINHRLSRTYTKKQVEAVLHEKCCLVILDGLDEWNHPRKCKHRHTNDDIPHRSHRTNNTVLTTTRPWKISVIRLTPAEIDELIQIKELSETKSDELASKAIKFLNEKTGKRKNTDNLFQSISSLILREIRNIPYIYTQSICLWFEDRDIGNSMCQVYSNILELTLERASLKPGCSRPGRQEFQGMSLPSCLKELKHCPQYLGLISKVSKSAFSSLIKTESRQMLVMDSEFTREYLTKEELELCLKLGLLNQEKNYGTVARRLSNVSFNHKTLHEFFAAFYLYSAGNSSKKEKVLSAVIQKCRSPSDIMEMSNIFVFLSGFDSKLYCELSERMADTVIQDDRIRRYRQTGLFCLADTGFYLALNYQKLQTDCAREMELNGQEVPALPLQDIIIDEDTKCEENIRLLQKITNENERNLKSLFIMDCESTREATHILQALNFTTFKCLQKLDLRCTARQQDVNKLLQRSQTTLQTLCLRNTYFKENRLKEIYRQLSQEREELILHMSALQALFLQAVILEHAQIERVAAFITSRNTMTGVSLSSIRCKDHKDCCAGVTLDLSQHENMVELQLHDVPVSQLNLNTQHLEKCWIGKLATCVVRSLFTCLPTAQHLRILACKQVLDNALPDLIDTIPALTQLEFLYIGCTDVGDRRLVISPNMTKLKFIYLLEVTLQSAFLRDLADTLINHSLTVIVGLNDCTVAPQKDFQALKKKMKTSSKFLVLEDGLDSCNKQTYIFQTNPEKNE